MFDFNKIAARGNEILAAAGFRFGLSVVGDEEPQSLMLGCHVTLAPLRGGQWQVTAFNANIVAIQFGSADADEAKPILLPKCDSLHDALFAGVDWMARRGVREFQQGFNDSFPSDGTALVKAITDGAVPIVDGEVLFQRAISLCGSSITDCLPKGAIRWLQFQKWEDAKPVFTLKSHYRASIERHGRPATYFDDWILNDIQLADSYDRAEKVPMRRYLRGVALPSEFYKDGYDLYFVVPHKAHPYVYRFRVRAKDFDKNFAWEVPDDATTDITITSFAPGDYRNETIGRKIAIQRLFNADTSKAPLFLLNREIQRKFAQDGDIFAKVEVDATGVNQRLVFFICKVDGEMLFLNYSAGSALVDADTKRLPFKTFDGADRPVPVVAKNGRGDSDWMQIVAASPKFAPFFDFARIFFKQPIGNSLDGEVSA